MSSRLTCVECHQPIPNGKAVIRSRAFRQVAYHGYCWTVRRIMAAFRAAA